ncbi:MAG: NnrU family protein [Beijerinckiaceae bacterium]
MTLLIAGLAIFIAAHVFVTMRGWRQSAIATLGTGGYRTAFSVFALTGLVSIVFGYARYRASGYIPVWEPPLWASHLAIPLVWIAFVFGSAFFTPPGRIRVALQHPLLAGLAVWACAHLLTNGDLGSILLFGSALAWTLYSSFSLRWRERVDASAAVPSAAGDILALAIGTLLFACAFWLHPYLVGVPILL